MTATDVELRSAFGRTPTLAARPGRRFDRLALGTVLFAVLVALMVFGPALTGYDSSQANLDARLQPPLSPGHVLGTDAVGRDMWSRVVDGVRWSGGIGIVATLVSGSLGTVVGLTAAMTSGLARRAATSVVDAGIAFPYLVLALVVVGIGGRSFLSIALTLGLVTWPVFARVVLAETSRLLALDYLRAAELMGAGRARTIRRHILPALVPSLSVIAAYSVGELIIAEGVLSFLGVGAPIGTASLGNMLAESQPYLVSASWLLSVPATAIAAWTVTANVFADGLAARTSRTRTGSRS